MGLEFMGLGFVGFKVPTLPPYISPQVLPQLGLVRVRLGYLIVTSAFARCWGSGYVKGTKGTMSCVKC